VYILVLTFHIFSLRDVTLILMLIFVIETAELVRRHSLLLLNHLHFPVPFFTTKNF